jgi:hypothetical protein
MADVNNTPVPSKSKIMRILNGAAGLKDLTPNQRMLKLADMSKVNVKNLIRLGGIKGAALTAAVDMAMRFLPEAKEQGKGVDPLNLFGPKKKKDRVDKKAVEAAVKEAVGSDTAPKKSVNPKTRSESSAPIESKRPRKRPANLKDGGMPMVMKDGKKIPAYAADGVGKMMKGGMAKKKKAASNYAYGGMAKAKPRTGNTDYRMGGMFMKSGKK